jgi:hypothetical protein
MSLLTNIQGIKRFVGGGANTSLKFESVEPIIHDAARDHLIPYLGQAFWQLVNGEATAQLAETDPILDYIRRPLARLTMYEYVKIGSVQMSDIGITTRTTENETVAYRYLQKQYADDMLVKGYEALEEMLVFLMSNRTAYPLWFNGQGGVRHTELLVRYAAQLRLHYGMDVSRYSYEILRGILRDVEYMAFDGVLPAQFAEHLRTVNETTDATPSEQKALMMAQAVITHFAIEEGVRRFWVQFNGRSVTHAETVGDQATTNQKTGSDNAVKMKLRHHELWANRHVSRLIAFLKKNKAEFPLCFSPDEGGTNTDADAWKEKTETEVVADEKKLQRRGIVHF